MKKIKALTSFYIQGTTDPVNINQAKALTDSVRQPKMAILESALTIESTLSRIISHHFFGLTHEKKSAFQTFILDSDWCTFAAKRKLIMQIIEDRSLLEGKAKSNFSDLLRKIMSLRNAFVHGNISTDGVKVWLSYFEANPRMQELTDEYLDSVERLISEAHSAVEDLAQKSETTTRIPCV